MATMTAENLRQAGLEALRRELGVVGMVRFLQQFELGHGDYTVERWRWLSADAEVDGLVAAIKQETTKRETPTA